MTAATDFAISARLAVRELRSGLQGFRIFLMCLFLGVAAIAVVGTLSASIERGIADQGQPLLGGDIEFSFNHREASAEEYEFLAASGTLSVVATLRAMVSFGDAASLVELKAVDELYPLFGGFTLDGEQKFPEAIAERDAYLRVVIEPVLRDRLGLKIGDTIRIGEAEFLVAATIAAEPDRVSDGFILGPRVLMTIEGLNATGLIKPGSLVRWRYRLKLDPPADAKVLKSIIRQAKKQHPDAGWRIRDRERAAPGVDRFLERLTFFLTLVGLTSLVVGGVGIANAVKAFVDRRRSTIATLKCIGATSRQVVAAYAIEILLIAAIGVTAGVLLGAIAPFAASILLAGALPVPISPSLEVIPLLRAVAFGFLVTIAFAAWPLGRMQSVAPSALFRESMETVSGVPPRSSLAVSGFAILLISLLAYSTLPDGRITLWYIGGIVAAFGTLTVLARIIMTLAETHIHPRGAVARYAVANLYRPGAPTPSIILSLGLGLTLFVTLALVDTNLSAQLRSTIPQQAPSFFFLDVPNSQRSEFVKLVKAHPTVGEVKVAPMLRGRVVSVAGVNAAKVEATPETRWALRGDRGLTYSEDLPAGSELSEGEWWPAGYDGEPLVSFTQDIADGISLKIGDKVTINVLGREVTAKVSSFRKVDWRSLNINFVMVFSPNTLQGAPHMNIVTVNMAEDQAGRLLKSVSSTYPTVTAVRVRDVLDAVNVLLAQLVSAIRYATAITFVVGILVLAGAMASGLSRRIYDSVVLKTHGATRRQLVGAYVVEFALVGLVAAAFAILIGSVAAWAIMRFVLEMPFEFAGTVSGFTAIAGAVLTILAGFATTWRALAARPARVLRAE